MGIPDSQRGVYVTLSEGIKLKAFNKYGTHTLHISPFKLDWFHLIIFHLRRQNISPYKIGFTIYKVNNSFFDVIDRIRNIYFNNKCQRLPSLGTVYAKFRLTHNIGFTDFMRIGNTLSHPDYLYTEKKSELKHYHQTGNAIKLYFTSAPGILRKGPYRLRYDFWPRRTEFLKGSPLSVLATVSRAH